MPRSRKQDGICEKLEKAADEWESQKRIKTIDTKQESHNLSLSTTSLNDPRGKLMWWMVRNMWSVKRQGRADYGWIQLAVWKKATVVEIWTTVDTRSVINHCSLLPPHIVSKHFKNIWVLQQISAQSVLEWNLAQGHPSVKLQYHNPAKSSFVCVGGTVEPPPPLWTVEVPQDRAAATGDRSILWGSTTPPTTTTATTLLLQLGILPVLRYCCYGTAVQHNLLLTLGGEL